MSGRPRPGQGRVSAGTDVTDGRENGGDGGARTPDLGIANAALSQLSYIPTGALPRTCVSAEQLAFSVAAASIECQRDGRRGRSMIPCAGTPLAAIGRIPCGAGNDPGPAPPVCLPTELTVAEGGPPHHSFSLTSTGRGSAQAPSSSPAGRGGDPGTSGPAGPSAYRVRTVKGSRRVGPVPRGGAASTRRRRFWKRVCCPCLRGRGAAPCHCHPKEGRAPCRREPPGRP